MKWRTKSLRLKQSDVRNWHRKFLWEPVIIDGYYVWLQFVCRRYVTPYGDGYWEYKFMEPPFSY